MATGEKDGDLEAEFEGAYREYQSRDMKDRADASGSVARHRELIEAGRANPMMGLFHAHR
jgi:hypothetical protein